MTIYINGKKLQKEPENKGQIYLAIAKVVIFSILLELVFQNFAGVSLAFSIIKGVWRCLSLQL